MLSREKILESLLDLSGRSATRSRPELLGMVMRSAMALTESDGSVAVVSPGRKAERFVLRTDMRELEVTSLAPANGDAGRPMLLNGQIGRAHV